MARIKAFRTGVGRMIQLFMSWQARIAFLILLAGLVAFIGPVSTATPTIAGTYGTPASPAPNSAPATPTTSVASPMIISGSGDITATVDQYRALLGDPNNVGMPGTQPSGRREINWDGVPDNLAAPNFLPSDFFNGPAAPLARGAVFTTPGTGVQVSANSVNPTNTPVRFGNINPSYSDLFQTFSPERLFSPIGSNIVDLTFFVPGTQTPAQVSGFGAVYTNVHTDHTSFEYFDKNGQSLGQFKVPAAGGSGGLSFLGVMFSQPVVAHVQIAYGTVALGPDDSTENNVAVMDDFLYGEPQAIPSHSGMDEAPIPTPADSRAV
jgi:hypothetical protein